jgi:succinoglycan biosynthesis transport protein ExoP
MLPPINERRQIERPQEPRLPAVLSAYAVPEISGNEPAAAQTGMGFLWRRKGTIAVAAICGLLAGGAISLLSNPVYRAHTSLQLEDFNQAFREVSPVSQLANASSADYLQNEVKVLESETLLRRVNRQLGLSPRDKPEPLHDLLGLVKKAAALLSAPAAASPISVRTGVQSQVIDVFFDAPDPVLAARGANVSVSEFMNMNREARQQLVQETTEWLNKQGADLKTRLQSLNYQLQDFTARSGLILAGNGNTPAEERVRQLQDALTRAEADRAGKEARYEAAAATAVRLVSNDLPSSPLHQYETDLQNMNRQLADLQTIYTPDNYKVTRLQAQIAETEAAIQTERQDVLGRMRNDYIAAASLERTLSRSLASQVAIAGGQTTKQLQYEVLKNDVDTTQKLYDSILERANQAGAASSLRITNIRVIDPAIPPRHPYSPNLPLNLALGLGIGTIGGVALVLMGARSSKVKQLGELTLMSVPELGFVPSTSDGSAIARRDTTGLAVRGEFDSFLLRESVRTVLTSILLSTRLKHGSMRGRARSRVLVVTSVEMMEGKSTIVTNLGIASAQQKCNVLLIDADLRRPSLHERFGLSNDAGLTDLLRRPELLEPHHKAARESLIQPTQTPNLWVLSSGPTDTAAARLLYSQDLNAVIDKLADRFDLIFIDTPPMSMYSDARVLGKASDGVVMVVRANTISCEEVRAAYQKLLHDQIRVLGTILNDCKIDRAKARAYARHYHRYEQQGGSAA